MKPDTVSYKLYTVNQIKTFQTMEALSELKRIATTVRHSLPPPRREPRRERRSRLREQRRLMKRTSDGSDIQSNKRRKDFGKPGF